MATVCLRRLCYGGRRDSCCNAVAGAYDVFNSMGDGSVTLPVFVIYAQGRIVWSQVGKDANDRPVPNTVMDLRTTQFVFTEDGFAGGSGTD